MKSVINHFFIISKEQRNHIDKLSSKEYKSKNTKILIRVKRLFMCTNYNY